MNRRALLTMMGAGVSLALLGNCEPSEPRRIYSFSGLGEAPIEVLVNGVKRKLFRQNGVYRISSKMGNVEVVRQVIEGTLSIEGSTVIVRDSYISTGVRVSGPGRLVIPLKPKDRNERLPTPLQQQLVRSFQIDVQS